MDTEQCMPCTKKKGRFIALGRGRCAACIAFYENPHPLPTRRKLNGVAAVGAGDCNAVLPLPFPLAAPSQAVEVQSRARRVRSARLSRPSTCHLTLEAGAADSFFALSCFVFDGHR